MAKTSNNGFLLLNNRESTLFEVYEPQAYSDLFKALQLAGDNISQRILRTKGDWTRTKLLQVQKLINEEIGNSYGGLFASMQDEVIATSNIVAGAYAGSSYQLPKAVINELINSQRVVQGYGFKELFDISENGHARQLRILVASGVAEGRTAIQIANGLDIKNTKLSKGQIKNNIFTTISDSRSIARGKAYTELEKTGLITGYIYEATLDSGTTLYCRNHDQRVYNKPIEEIQHLINTHFGERSVFRPITETTDIKTRSSMFGEVPAQNYETWFKSTSKEFQRSTLKNRQYSAFINGDYKVKTLGDLTGKTNLSDVKKLI